MPRPQPKWGRVLRYEGKRGVVWRIRYRDAAGRRILETLGKEPAWNGKRAEAELRRRLVDVERDGLRKPVRLLFADFAERWLSDYLPGRGLKRTTLDGYRQTLNRHLIPYFGSVPLHQLEQQPRADRPLHRRQDPSRPRPQNRHQPPARAAGDAQTRRPLAGDPTQPRPRRRPPPRQPTRTEHPHRRRNRAPLDRIPRARTISRQRRTTVVATRTHDHLRRTQHRHAPRRTPRPPLERHPPTRRHPRRPRSTRQRPLHPPKSRASRRLLELGPQTQNLLSQHWQHTAFQGDDELVFCHPNKGTPLDPSKLARVYLRPALRHAGSTNSYDPSTTSATPHSPTKPPPATPWPTSSNAPATPTQRSPSATSTPHKSTSPAPPRAAKHTSSPHARTTQPLRNNRSLRIVEELDLPQETFGLQSRISRLENGAPVTLQDVVELNVGLGRNVLSGSGVPYVDTKPAGGDRSSA